jgi:Uma2 family endonuclease
MCAMLLWAKGKRCRMTLADAVKSSAAALTVPERERGHFLFEDVDWEYYELTLKQLERAGQHARVTYDEGRMEIMTKTGWHEIMKTAVARLLEHYSVVIDVPIQGAGESTCKRRDQRKGVEADEWYFVTHSPVLDDQGYLDVKDGPPPDLAIESEVSRTLIERQPIYARLRIAEVWRVSLEGIIIERLEGEEYRAVEKSVFFPNLDMNEFFRFVKIAVENQHRAIKEFDAWVRATGIK